MNGNLYRVEFRTSLPQFIYAQDAVSAKNEAASNLSAIVRPATSGEMLEWISVEIKLPDNDDDVLVYNPRDGISIGEFNEDEVRGCYEADGSYFITNSGWQTQYDWAPYMSPTHWMPLPSIPEEK